MDPIPQISIRLAQSPADFEQARELFAEYAASLDIDLSFQNFEAELGSLPGDYAEPAGCILLADIDGVLAGCCAMRPLMASAYSNACEMKRLYVRKLFRGFGLGRRLAENIMEMAVLAGYSWMLLDTIDEMESARALYEDLGFVEIEPYYFNPHPGATYLRAPLNN
ncbi:GNAT family N-acetyltransferase [Corticibacter populi]|uniref:GNAT family N-acetyltransferase n=1 Tax=Corticibacter populi TaxID=1550736 RepID=A0A3M6QS08_9BURK|nr:GNAT family N-acetyltransferase [Corticibacter populi]RMX05816.1 GNAT family N-acetyltransferase [Corticibacter populi]RZS30872.1 ribosomal protein S18 acetylase RimI-like enzyme [Corticibacter populi]